MTPIIFNFDPEQHQGWESGVKEREGEGVWNGGIANLCNGGP